MLLGRLGLETARIPQADRHGLLWLSRGKLYVEDGTLRFKTAGGELEAGDYAIPFQMLTNILLGPGGSVTHDALRLLARHGTGLIAVGEGGGKMYASMPFGKDDSALARKQVRLWSDEQGARMDVARRMYAWRLGEILPQSDIAVLRGIEGSRMKETYRLLAQQHGVLWKGRRYDRSNPSGDDLPNQAINHSAAAVQASAMIAVAATGTIPQLGFIHEDSSRAFCLDVADLFRDEITLPVAFAASRLAMDGHELEMERLVRRTAAKSFREKKLIPNMIRRIKELLDGDDGDRDA